MSGAGASKENRIAKARAEREAREAAEKAADEAADQLVQQQIQMLTTYQGELEEEQSKVELKLQVLAMIPALKKLATMQSFGMLDVQPGYQAMLNKVQAGFEAYNELQGGDYNNDDVSLTDYNVLVNSNRSTNSNNINSNNSNTTRFRKTGTIADRKVSALYSYINRGLSSLNRELYGKINTVLKTIADSSAADAVDADEFSEIIDFLKVPIKAYKLWKLHLAESKTAGRGLKEAQAAKTAAVKAAEEAAKEGKKRRVREIYQQYYVGGEDAKEFYDRIIFIEGDKPSDSMLFWRPYSLENEPEPLNELSAAMTRLNSFGRLAEELADARQEAEKKGARKPLVGYGLEFAINRIERREIDRNELSKLREYYEKEAASNNPFDRVNVYRVVNMIKMINELILLLKLEVNKSNYSAMSNFYIASERDHAADYLGNSAAAVPGGGGGSGAGSKGGRRRTRSVAHSRRKGRSIKSRRTFRK